MPPATWFLLLLPLPGSRLPGSNQSTLAASSLPKTTLPARRNGRIGRLRSFAPVGYKVLMQKKADLNLDGKADALLILCPRNEAQRYEALKDVNDELPPRLLLLLTGTANSLYQLQVRSPNVTYRYGYDSNFRDSLDELTLGRGWFTINHYNGQITRTARTTTFTYQPATASWRLTNDKETMWHSMHPEEPHTSNLLKHHVSLTRFTIYE